MSFLTKELADALCTAIVIGFIKTDASRTAIQYYKDETTNEQPDYETVQTKLKTLGVQMEISPSALVTETAYIVAKTPKVPTFDYSKDLSIDFWKYLSAITKSANALGDDAPYGAYIGGLSTISSLFIIGPSNLDQYQPQFRPSDDTNVSTSYANAIKATNTALQCLKKDTPTTKPSGVTLNFTDLNSPISAPFQSGKVFKSYHGMIQAIVKYQTNIDTNSFIFEISLGNNTKKVSSCLPCSIFMMANNTPATSTHLGRGDNWNIPSSCNSTLRAAWSSKVNSYFKTGMGILASNPKASALNSSIIANNVQSNIADIYLEALTFESKISDKIINTLS